MGEINMRCKNCGTYNDDNRYICETCGSPLYDEEDIQTPEEESRTQTFNAVTEPVRPTDTSPSPSAPQPDRPDKDGKNEKTPAEKKSIIVIAILAVVLVAIIVSVIVVAVNSSRNEDETTTDTTTTQQTTESTTRWTTQRATERRTTTTTTTTTALQTTTTTTQRIYYINANSSGGGTVSGGGEYQNGDRVTLTAAADNGYVFDGWYSDGIKVSSSESYSFIANENASFSAVFSKVETTADDSGEGDVNFGE